MRTNLMRLMLIAGLCLMTGLNAFAGTKTKTIKFYEDVTVNGTVVKAGVYRVKFDADKNELSIRNGKKIVATATTRTEQEAAKAKRTMVKTLRQDNTSLLTSITFGGTSQSIVIEAGTNAIPSGN